VAVGIEQRGEVEAVGAEEVGSLGSQLLEKLIAGRPKIQRFADFLPRRRVEVREETLLRFSACLWLGQCPRRSIQGDFQMPGYDSAQRLRGVGRAVILGRT
jgi:hypothetical protein